MGQNAFPGSLTDVQYYDKNIGAHFMLPKFTSFHSSCALVRYEVSTVSGSVVVPGSNFVNNPVETFPGSGYYKFAPQDDNRDATYLVYIRFVADNDGSNTGGAEVYSTLMTLHIGCPPNIVTVTAATDFIYSVSKFVSDTRYEVYEYKPPTIFPSYCYIVSN